MSRSAKVAPWTDPEGASPHKREPNITFEEHRLQKDATGTSERACTAPTNFVPVAMAPPSPRILYDMLSTQVERFVSVILFAETRRWAQTKNREQFERSLDELVLEGASISRQAAQEFQIFAKITGKNGWICLSKKLLVFHRIPRVLALTFPPVSQPSSCSPATAAKFHHALTSIEETLMDVLVPRRHLLESTASAIRQFVPALDTGLPALQDHLGRTSAIVKTIEHTPELHTPDTSIFRSAHAASRYVGEWETDKEWGGWRGRRVEKRTRSARNFVLRGTRACPREFVSA